MGIALTPALERLIKSMNGCERAVRYGQRALFVGLRLLRNPISASFHTCASSDRPAIYGKRQLTKLKRAAVRRPFRPRRPAMAASPLPSPRDRRQAPLSRRIRRFEAGSPRSTIDTLPRTAPTVAGYA